MHIVFLIIIVIFLIFLSMINRRVKKMSLILLITSIVLIIVRFLDSLMIEKNISKPFEKATFIGLLLIMVVFLFVRLLRKNNIKKLSDSGEIVNGTISYVKEIGYYESQYNAKYQIVFKYLGEDGNQKECHTYKFYTLEEVNKIKELGDSIQITVAGKICKINEDISSIKLDNLKNIPIHQKGRNTGFLMDFMQVLFSIIFIAVFTFASCFALNLDLNVGIPISICFFFLIIYFMKNLYELYRTKKAYKEGLETFAVNFEFYRTRRYGWCFISYSYKTEDGKTKRKKQLVAFHIYQNGGYMDKLPIKVLGNDASIDIEKVENFTAHL